MKRVLILGFLLIFLVSITPLSQQASAKGTLLKQLTHVWWPISTNDGFTKSFIIYKKGNDIGYIDTGYIDYEDPDYLDYLTEIIYTFELQCKNKKLTALVYSEPLGIYPAINFLTSVGTGLVRIDKGKISKYPYREMRASVGISFNSPKTLTTAILKGKKTFSFKIPSAIQADTVANFSIADLRSYVNKFKSLGCPLTPFVAAIEKAAAKKAAAKKAAAKKAAAKKAAVVEKAAAGITCPVKGKCEIGNKGPGGGIVFYVAPRPQSWGQYLEVAPATWNGRSTDPKALWCDVRDVSLVSTVTDPELKKLIGTEIGKGKGNTQLMTAFCTTGAANLANAYRGGGKSDWFLPSIDELNQLCRYARGQTQSASECDETGKLKAGFDSTVYWSSSEDDADFAWFQAFSAGIQMPIIKSGDFFVRPVRAFS